jgi:hypothetical protein
LQLKSKTYVLLLKAQNQFNMKKAFLYIFFFSLSTTLWAQEVVTRSYNASTLLKDGGRPTGGFIGLQPKVSYLPPMRQHTGLRQIPKCQPLR